MANIREIAKKANVNPSTVSRALNNQSGVSEKTRQHILDITKEANYRQNKLAAGIFNKKSHSLGLIFSDLGPHRACVYQGCLENILDRSYLPYLGITHFSVDIQGHLLEHFFQHRVDGLIICSHDSDFFKNWEKYLTSKFPDIPIVFIDSMPSRKKVPFSFDFIKFDNKRDLKLITQYMIDKGHKKIAYLGGIDDAIVFRERENGYLETMKRNGLAEHSLIIKKGINFQAASQEIDELLENHPAYTAALSSTEISFQGHLIRTLDKGKKPGKDLDFIYHLSNKSMDFDKMYPGIPYVLQDSRRQGEEATRLIFEHFVDPDRKRVTISIPGQLVE